MRELPRLRPLLTIAAAALLILAVAANAAQAQPRYPGNGTLEIWNTAIFDSRGYIIYIFILNRQGLDIESGTTINDVKIQTNHGDITLERPISGIGADDSIYGHLYVRYDDNPKILREIEIIKATGVYKNRQVDITHLIKPIRFVPVRLKMRN